MDIAYWQYEIMMKAYKLFILKKGKLFPLYVNAMKETPMHQWIDAEEGPITKNGKVKSRLGELAFRPGWHSGDYPVALHIGEKQNKNDSKPSYRPDNQVWAEVEVHDEVDWQSIANEQGKHDRDKCLKCIPKNGYYKYKTNPNMYGMWIISGEIKINKILTDEEVFKINSETGIHDLSRR